MRPSILQLNARWRSGSRYAGARRAAPRSGQQMPALMHCTLSPFIASCEWSLTLMRLRIFSLCLLAAAALLAQPTTSYRLNFSFHELGNGKRLSTRNYSMLLEPNTFVKLNVGSKMPVPSNAGPNVQYSYIDVGVNLRARIQEQGPDLRLNAEIEMSNLGADKDVQNRPLPQIRQIRAE